jgi:peptidoglycan/xylan/chitin deacetylase (PgdA/CDA1 family)
MRLEDWPLTISTRPTVVAAMERFMRRRARSQSRGARAEIGLTFDDGPHPQWTPRVLDELDRISARATFFVVGRSAKAHGAIVREAKTRGHEIGTHLYSHERGTVFDDRAFADELSRSRDELEDLLGERIRWLRFPYGERGRQDPRAVEKKFGIGVAHWTYSTHDTKLRDPEHVVARFRAGLRAGAIVLLHDALADEKTVRPPYLASREVTIAALSGIGRALASRGLRSVTLSDLFAHDRARDTAAND